MRFGHARSFKDLYIIVDVSFTIISLMDRTTSQALCVTKQNVHHKDYPKRFLSARFWSQRLCQSLKGQDQISKSLVHVIPIFQYLIKRQKDS